MDCSLSTWPSITQFDDFSWAGLGDIDLLESLDRSLNNEPGPSLPNLPATKSSISASTMPCSDISAPISHTQNDNPISHTQNDSLYRLTSSESLAAARWESINGVDLASVLDSTFPSNDDASTPSEHDVYDLYNDNILNDVDAFMSNSECKAAEGNAMLRSDDHGPLDASLMISEMPQEEVKCESGTHDGDSSGSINVSQVATSDPMSTSGDCNAHHADIFDNRSVFRLKVVRPFPFNSVKPSVCGGIGTSSQCALDLKESMFPRRLDCIQPGLMMPWSKALSTSTNLQGFEGEKVVHPGTLHVGDNYPAIMDQQVRLADAATVEMKRNRAQASRARRLAANQRRAKKYPLQKLIRMSSLPTSTRDRLEHNVDNPGAMMQMVSPGQYAGGVQSRRRVVLNSQVPGFLPVLQSPHLSSRQELLSQVNPVQVGPYYCYQQTSVTPTEDKGVSSGSGAMQSMSTDQDVQSLSSTPTATFSQLNNSTQSLDAALLEQLQAILGKMNANVRLCIRDALYRLANSSKHRQCRNEASDSSSCHSNEEMETNTNSIDRWIVNILFCKQSSSFKLNSELHQLNPTLAQNQYLQACDVNSASQQWNSCGSSINLQGQPLHIVRGL